MTNFLAVSKHLYASHINTKDIPFSHGRYNIIFCHFERATIQNNHLQITMILSQHSLSYNTMEKIIQGGGDYTY